MAEIQRIKIRPNVATPWLISWFTLSTDALSGTAPNTLLGLVKKGTRQITQPLRSITNVFTQTRFRVVRLIVSTDPRRGRPGERVVLVTRSLATMSILNRRRC